MHNAQAAQDQQEVFCSSGVPAIALSSVNYSAIVGWIPTL